MNKIKTDYASITSFIVIFIIILLFFTFIYFAYQEAIEEQKTINNLSGCLKYKYQADHESWINRTNYYQQQYQNCLLEEMINKKETN